MDTLTPDQRHKNMSRIRSRNTKPEVWLRKKLFNRGYRYRNNASNVPGHPDIWMKKYNTAVFVHGCFWHRHKNCKYATTPKTNVEFWNEKFRKNVERDNRVKEELENSGIRALIVWECTVKQMKKNPENEERVLNEIEEFLSSDEMRKEL